MQLHFPIFLIALIAIQLCFVCFSLTLNGRYTRDLDLDEFHLLVPRKLSKDGSFLTYSLKHFFNHRAKRSPEPSVSYGLTLNGKEHHVDLWPNRNLLSPSAIRERRDYQVNNTRIERISPSNQCQFVGKIRGLANSKVALSTCDGLAGYVNINGRRYFIEPLHEHGANKRGQLLHMMYEKGLGRFEGPSCGTRQDWRDAWRERFRAEEELAPVLEKRGLTSVHRYLESLVVVDKKFLDYHKNTDYELYILTIMNMVSDYYSDASLGNQIDFVVVRIMYLDKQEEEIDLEISVDSEKTLASFCKWQQRVNPKDIKNPNHHDIAILLTRYDLCASSKGVIGNCGLMGLAYLATACTDDKSCAINEDAGLILGIVVAHEVGHVLGSSHDAEDSGCKAQAEDKSYHVMSPFVHLHTNVWSTCSKTFITTFFDNDLGECLNNEPQTSLFENNNMLPGTVYDATYQCQMDFPGSSVCRVSDEKFCQRLLCKTKPTMCTSKGEPPADGTKCGENKWCYDMKCVEIGERPAAVNGGWGDWGPFSECSRSCGGGASLSERHCNNPQPQHRGRYCIGDRKKIKICNTQPCPEGAKSFRAVQCSAFDDKPFEGKKYKWRPFNKNEDSCALYCINDANVYVKLSPSVKDGTKCKAGTRNMCIASVCRKIGCDYVVDSDAIEDECGVCKGDGTECKIVEHTFQAPPGRGYVKVAVIFRGCRKIIVEELKPSPNTIAITGPDEKHYYLNGDFSEMSDGVREIGGSEGIYTHPEPDQEMLVIHGPLKENIVLFVVFYQNENVGYKYKYAEPNPKSNYQPTYHWEFVDWQECSAKCGGGIETSEAKCIEEKTGLVSSSFCQQADKPPAKKRKCNERPCITKWRVSKWSKCLACKNLAGVRMRQVECVQEAAKPGEEAVLVDDSKCTGPKPGNQEICNSEQKCTKRKTALPADQMRNVWLQTHAHLPEINPQLVDFLTTDQRAKTRMLRRNLRRFSVFQKRTKEEKCPANSTQTNRNETVNGSGGSSGSNGSSSGSAGPVSGSGGSSDGKSGGRKPDLKVGTIVKDPVEPNEGLKLIEIPVKQSHNAINMTDEAFEEMGDQVPDTLDEQHEKVYRNEEAAKLMIELEHAGNNSQVEST